MVDKQDPKQLEYMAYLVERGFGKRFEMQVHPHGVSQGLQFSAILNSNHLRDPVESLMARYSSHPDAQFSVVGVVSQKGRPSNLDATRPTPNSFRAFMETIGIVSTQLEDWFGGLAENEVSIDPIAAYREL